MLADDIGYNLMEMMESGRLDFEDAWKMWKFSTRLPAGAPRPSVIERLGVSGVLYWQYGGYSLHVGMGLGTDEWRVLAWITVGGGMTTTVIDFDGVLVDVPWLKIMNFLENCKGLTSTL